MKRSVESTNQIHLVAVIASYIHHHDDPHVPAGNPVLCNIPPPPPPIHVCIALYYAYMCVELTFLCGEKAFLYYHKFHTNALDESIEITFLSFFAGATNLLVRLSHVAPMSVFACLGQEAVAVRDAFISRLKAHVEVYHTQYCIVVLRIINLLVLL